MCKLLKYFFCSLVFVTACNSVPSKKEGVVNTKMEMGTKDDTLIYASIFPGGVKMVVERNNDLVLLDSTDSMLYKKEDFSVINTASDERNPAFSPNGRQLFFASDRPGGVGGYDIYIATIDENFKIKEVINLGPTINTKFDEIHPYVSKDGMRFYYSSSGHSSIGGFDVFKADIKPSGFSLSDAMTDINTMDDDKLYDYFFNEGFAIVDSLNNEGRNRIIVNPSFIMLEEDSLSDLNTMVNHKNIIEEYLKGDVGYQKLMEVFGHINFSQVHYEIQIGAAMGELKINPTINSFGKIVVRGVDGDIKRYSLGIYETLDEAEKVIAELSKIGHKDAFLVCYLNGEKVSLSEILKKYLKNEMGS